MDDLERLLRARLRQPEPTVPAAVEAAILGAASDAAAGVRRRRALRLVRVSTAAAAVIALGAWLGARFLPTPDRALDVVDAWRVAAGLERSERRFDLNGDGSLDRRDADLMLARIVTLEPRRKS